MTWAAQITPRAVPLQEPLRHSLPLCRQTQTSMRLLKRWPLRLTECSCTLVSALLSCEPSRELEVPIGVPASRYKPGLRLGTESFGAWDLSHTQPCCSSARTTNHGKWF